MNLTEFKSKWIGKRIDYDNSYGFQCVDLVKQSSEDLYGVAIGSFSGSALNAWNTGSPFNEDWTRVENMPDRMPLPGAIVFFDKESYNPYGHTAVVDAGSNSISLKVIEQNGGKGSGTGLGTDAIREFTYNYLHPKCLGWYIYNPNSDMDYQKIHSDVMKETGFTPIFGDYTTQKESVTDSDIKYLIDIGLANYSRRTLK